MASARDKLEVAAFRHGRVPRAVREEQILRLAEELFAERGYEGASMDELARRAGVSKPVIYDVVGSKERLFERAFERAGDELAAAIAEAVASHLDDPEGMLRACARAFLHFIDHHEGAWAVLYRLDTGGRTDAQVQAIRTRQVAFATSLIARLTTGADRRRTEAVAYMLNGAFEGLAHWRRHNADVPDDEAAAWLVEFTLPAVERFLATQGPGT